MDIDQVAVTGSGVRYCAIKKMADIKIESPDISNDTNFKVNVFSPSGQVVDVKTSIMANAIGAYYTPNEIGKFYNVIYKEKKGLHLRFLRPVLKNVDTSLLQFFNI